MRLLNEISARPPEHDFKAKQEANEAALREQIRNEEILRVGV
jgi:hypothetical protein